METRDDIMMWDPEPVGPARRMAAGLIDVAAILIGGLVYTLAVGSQQPRSGVSMAVNDRVVNDGGVWIFVLLALGYFMLMEVTLGATVGKLLTGLRVTMSDGGRLTPSAAVLRTLFRPVDGLPYVVPNLLGFILVAMTKRRQRLGDLVAGTVVIRRTAVT